MSRDDSPYTDDAYQDEYDDRDAYEEAYDDDGSASFFPYPASSFGWPPGVLGGGVEEEYDETARGGAYEDEPYGDDYDEDESWLDEGVIAFTLIAGLALFLFPEPATSAAGIVLLLVGSIAWLADAMT